MTIFLNASELAEVLFELDLPDELRALEAATTVAAQAIARKLDVETDDADTQPGFAGLCAPFWQKHDGQAAPENLTAYDPDGDWHKSGENV